MLTLREKHEYEQEIAQLKVELMSKAKTIVSLEGEIRILKEKVKYEKIKLSSKKLIVRKAKPKAPAIDSKSNAAALQLIAERSNGGIRLTLKQIAIECSLTYQLVKNLSMYYNYQIAAKEKRWLEGGVKLV